MIGDGFHDSIERGVLDGNPRNVGAGFLVMRYQQELKTSRERHEDCKI